MKKLILDIITVICAICLTWVAWSFVDIVSDNCDPNPQHANINAFVLLVD